MSNRTRRPTPPIPRPRPTRPGEQRPPAAPHLPEDFAEPGTTPGMYDGLGIEDKTDAYGDLGVRKRRGDPSEVILHQTMSTTGASTERAYEQRIRQGDHVGAHYLIDENGETSLTVPTDEVVYHAQGHNSSAIGIETVGMPSRVDRGGDLHAQIEAMELSPALKRRLLAMSPAELRRTMADNGDYIYNDITGPQKRANWNLLRAIAAEHGIELEADVESHEHVQAKTIGEGENIEEFVDAMLHWPARIEALEQRIAELQADPSADRALLQTLEAELAEQKAHFEAVQVDATPQENNALEGEGLLGQAGPATAREERRREFWDEFYPNMQRLDDLLIEGPSESLA